MSAWAEARTWLTVPGAEFGEVGPQRLDRISDEQRRGLLLRQRRQDVLDAGFGSEPDGRVGEPEALGAEPDLGDRLLAGDIHHRMAGAGERPGRLKEQRRLADSGIAADQQCRAAHQPAAGHPVELGDTRPDPRRLGGVAGQPLQRDEAALAGAPLRASGDAARTRLLDQRIPFAAVVALALPARAHRPAILADELGLGAGEGDHAGISVSIVLFMFYMRICGKARRQAVSTPPR